MFHKGWRDSSNEWSRKMTTEEKLLGWTTLESLAMFTRQVSPEGGHKSLEGASSVQMQSEELLGWL